MRIEQRLAIEFDDFAYKPAEGIFRCCLDGREHSTEEVRQTVRPQREPGHDAKAPAAAPLDPPEQVRVCAGVGDLTAPSAVTISASSRLAAAIP